MSRAWIRFEPFFVKISFGFDRILMVPEVASHTRRDILKRSNTVTKKINERSASDFSCGIRRKSKFKPFNDRGIRHGFASVK